MKSRRACGMPQRRVSQTSQGTTTVIKHTSGLRRHREVAGSGREQGERSHADLTNRSSIAISERTIVGADLPKLHNSVSFNGTVKRRGPPRTRRYVSPALFVAERTYDMTRRRRCRGGDNRLECRRRRIHPNRDVHRSRYQAGSWRVRTSQTTY